jgi:Methyltransferase domain
MAKNDGPFVTDRGHIAAPGAAPPAERANWHPQRGASAPATVGGIPIGSAILLPAHHVHAESAWNQHIPFAFWLMQAHTPSIFVELGTCFGTSYFSFCQAVAALQLPARCFAIDTWQGDSQTGFYDESVFARVNACNELKYARFSRLVRSTFDDALPHFLDGSVDLLHIDGLHTYDACRHDFESWLPKLSGRAIVLFHDTNVRERGFGVYRLWAELVEHYPHFEFVHEHGLGVLGVGAALDGPVRELFGAADDTALAYEVRAAFWRLSSAVRIEMELKATSEERARLETLLSATIGENRIEVSRLNADLEHRRVALAEEQRQAAELTARCATERNEKAELAMALAVARSEKAELEAALAGTRVEKAELRAALADAGQLELENKILNAEKRSLDAEFERLRAHSQSTDGALEALRGGQQVLGSELERLRADNEHLDAELNRLQVDNHSLDAESERLRAVHQSLDAELHRLNRERRDSLAELHQVEAERERLRLEVASLSQSLGAELQRLNREREDLLDELHQVEAERERLRLEVAALSQSFGAELQRLNREREGSLAELHQVEAERERLRSELTALSQSISAASRFGRRVLAKLGYSALGYPLLVSFRALKTRSFMPLRDWRAAYAIARSGLFDRKWYLETYPDVAAWGIDPIRHYVLHGAIEGRNPNSYFHTRTYVSLNPHVAAVGINPFAHYLTYGMAERRQPHG